MRRFPRAAWMVLLLACASTARATDVPQDVLDRLAGADLARSADSAMSVARASMLEGVSFAGPVDPDQYRVGPGDQFVLSITGSISRVVTLVVTPEDTALALGSGDVPVLATPRVVLLAEQAAVAALETRAVRTGVTAARLDAALRPATAAAPSPPSENRDHPALPMTWTTPLGRVFATPSKSRSSLKTPSTRPRLSRLPVEGLKVRGTVRW